MKAALQAIFAFILGVLAYFYYRLVLPDVVSVIFAVAISAAIIFSIVSNKFELKAFGLGGAVLTLWPLGALLVPWVAGVIGLALNEHQKVASAIFIAVPAGMASYFASEKRDKARDIAVLSLGIVCLYTIGYAIVSKDNIAIAIASFGVSLCALAAWQQLLLPPRQEFALKWAAGLAAVMGLANAGAVMIARAIW